MSDPRPRYTAAFWADLADLGEEVTKDAARALVREQRWSAFEGAVAGGIPARVAGAEIVALLAKACDDAARPAPGSDSPPAPLAENPRYRTLEPLLDAWVAALRKAPEVMVQAAQACLKEGTPACLAVVAKLTAAGMDWQACLHGERARALHDALQLSVTEWMAEEKQPHRLLAALLPARIDALPVLGVMYHGESDIIRVPLLEFVAAERMKMQGWENVTPLFALLRERCPAAHAELDTLLRQSLAMDEGWGDNVRLSSALLVAGQDLTAEVREQLVAVEMNVQGSREEGARQRRYLGAVINALSDRDGACFVRWWHRNGFDIDQARPEQPGHTPLRIALQELRFQVVAELLQNGANLLAEAPGEQHSSPLALMQASYATANNATHRTLMRGLLDLARAQVARQAASKALAAGTDVDVDDTTAGGTTTITFSDTESTRRLDVSASPSETRAGRSTKSFDRTAP